MLLQQEHKLKKVSLKKTISMKKIRVSSPLGCECAFTALHGIFQCVIALRNGSCQLFLAFKEQKEP